jgi:hypothetical protein
MTVAAQVSPESTMKGGGTGRSHDRSRGCSPSPPKRSRSVSEAQVLSFEAEDQFEEDPDFAPRRAPRRALPSLKSLINSDATEDELEQR